MHPDSRPHCARYVLLVPLVTLVARESDFETSACLRTKPAAGLRGLFKLFKDELPGRQVPLGEPFSHSCLKLFRGITILFVEAVLRDSHPWRFEGFHVNMPW